MSDVEMVELTLKLPKGIVDFLRASVENLDEWLAREIVDHIHGQLDADVFFDPKETVKKYNLMAVFKKYDLSVSSYLDPDEPY